MLQLRMQNGQFTAISPSQESLTQDILLKEVKLFGFMKKRFNFAMSKPTVLFIFYI